MAIYRPEQARLSFSCEPNPGGYVESNGKTLSNTPPTITDIKKDNINIIVSDASSLDVSDYLQIGTGPNNEIRRIINIDGTKITLDYPLGFKHETGEEVDKIDINNDTMNSTDRFNYITFLPGVYETIQVPDLVPELMPKYFLKSNNDRNWSYLYRGRQTFNGALGNLILLNGFPIRFAIGKESIKVKDGATQAITDYQQIIKRGSIEIVGNIDANTEEGNYIHIYGKENKPNEIRRIVSKNDNGSGATATATVDSDGAITRLTVENGGNGYTAGTVNITKTGDGSGATATAVVTSGAITGLTVVNGGTGYTAGTVNVVKSVITLNYPLINDYKDDNKVTKINKEDREIITHNILEWGKLDSITWNILMNDTDYTAGSSDDDPNGFIRRFVGGVVNRATLAADEGGMLMFSWDDVQFLDFVHNQVNQKPSNSVRGIGYDGTATLSASNINSDGSLKSTITVSGGSGYKTGTVKIVQYSYDLIDDNVDRGNRFLLKTLKDGIGGALQVNNSGSLSQALYPENEPYYFSEGTVSFFGQPFARIRNFRIEINNNIDPRYYIRGRNGSRRGPSEFQEQFKEYSMTASLAMQDSQSYNDATTTMWKELILEGNYQGFGEVGKLQGFDISLTFKKGKNEIVIKSPSNSTISPQLESQGCFFRRATHNIEQEAPVQAEGEIILRDLDIKITDDVLIYP